MDEEVITFGDTEIEKQKFYRYKSPIFLEDVNTDNILVPNKISSFAKNINTSLGSFMMVIKLNHYI